MNTYHPVLPMWSTAALSLSEDALPKDASALCKHLGRYKTAHHKTMHHFYRAVHGKQSFVCHFAMKIGRAHV